MQNIKLVYIINIFQSIYNTFKFKLFCRKYYFHFSSFYMNFLLLFSHEFTHKTFLHSSWSDGRRHLYFGRGWDSWYIARWSSMFYAESLAVLIVVTSVRSTNDALVSIIIIIWWYYRLKSILHIQLSSRFSIYRLYLHMWIYSIRFYHRILSCFIHHFLLGQ